MDAERKRKIKMRAGVAERLMRSPAKRIRGGSTPSAGV